MTDRDGRMQDYLLQLASKVRQHGWVVQGVFPSGPDDLGFAYTVGLTVAGLPELALSGAFGSQAQDLLNAAARVHLVNELKPGSESDEIANVVMRIIAAPDAEVNMARRLYGERVRAVQVCWPDADGKWPPGQRQELFGPAWWL